MCGSGKERFPASFRLKKASDFERVWREGKVVQGEFFTLRFLPRETGMRLGIVIPRRWGSAVERNRMKRIVREAFRRNKGAFVGIDLLVQPHGACKKTSADQVASAFLKEAQRAAGREVNSE